MKNTARWPLSFWLAALAAACLWIPGLSSRGVWVDEAHEIDLASSPLPEMWERIGLDVSPPGHYLFLKLWMALFGRSELALRCSSLLASAVSLALLYRLARRWCNPAAAAWGTALFAVSPLAFYYAAEIRPYGLMLTLSLATWLALDKALSTPGRNRFFLAYALLSVLTFLTTYAALGVLLAQGLYGFWRARARPVWWASVGAISLVWLIWTPMFARNLRIHPFAAMLYQLRGPMLLVDSWAHFCGSGPFYPHIVVMTSLPQWVTIATMLSALALVVAGVERTAPQLPAYLLLPPALLIVATMSGKPSYIVGRTDFVALPAFCLLAGSGLARLPRTASVTIALAWLALLARPLIALSTDQDRTRDRDTARLLAQLYQSGDVVLLTYGLAPSVAYYLSLDPRHIPVAEYPYRYFDRVDHGISEEDLKSEANAVRDRLVREAHRTLALFLMPASRDVLIPAFYDQLAPLPEPALHYELKQTKMRGDYVLMGLVPRHPTP